MLSKQIYFFLGGVRPREGLGLNKFRSIFFGPTKNNMVYKCMPKGLLFGAVNPKTKPWKKVSDAATPISNEFSIIALEHILQIPEKKNTF